MHILATLNLLLGWPWLHEHQEVPYILHKKIKMLIEGWVVTINEDNFCDLITNKGTVLEMEHDCDVEELYHFDTMATLENDQVPLILIALQT